MSRGFRMIAPWAGVGLVIFAIVFAVSAGGQPPTSIPIPELGQPLAPDQALAAFSVDPGIKIELVAAEPLVTDPVALCFDHARRAYVAEMGDYPLGPTKGRIRRLVDTNGDGVFDQATTFCDGLSYPNTVMAWRDGLLVCSAPDLLYLKDTDGDGVADVREVVFTGFLPGNPQHRFNGLTLGVDNWIYGADGQSATGIRPGNQPKAWPWALNGRDFRFTPDYRKFEVLADSGQFGQTFDVWGHRFVNDNSNHIRFPVLASKYLLRNRHYRPARVTDEIAVEGTPARVYPKSKIGPRFNDPEVAGYFTSACSPFIYLGKLFPPDFFGQAFACEPVHNLVHRDRLVTNGVSFVARSVTPGKEFLASTDSWFRPVNLVNGPDDAIYVVDMYRAVIEHPQWIPLDVQKHIDVRAGHDRGRIYRVAPAEGRTAKPIDLTRATTAELVAVLDAGTRWEHDTARRLLLERADPASLPLLRHRAVTPAQGTAQGVADPARLAAVWLVNALEGPNIDVIQTCLKDASSAPIRAVGLQLAEPLLRKNESVTTLALALAHDAELRVRFQAALSLGELPMATKVPALAAIADRDSADSWVRSAVMSSLSEAAVPFLSYLQTRQSSFFAKPAAVIWMCDLSRMVASRGEATETAEWLAALAGPPDPWRIAALAAFVRRVHEGGSSFARLLTSGPTRDALLAWHSPLASLAMQADAPVEARVDALDLLTHWPERRPLPRVEELLRYEVPAALQRAALRFLLTQADVPTVQKMVDQWSTWPLGQRRELADALLKRRELTQLLLDALESKRIPATEIEPALRDRLKQDPRPELAQRANLVFASTTSQERNRRIQAASEAVARLRGDPERGQKLYQTHCAQCHRLHGQGIAVGPDLASVTQRPTESLLLDILDPNRAVESRYLNYVVLTKQGQVMNGMIVNESPTHIVLRRAEGQESTVARQQIEALRSTGQSLMPDDLDQSLDAQALADLVNLLRQPRLHP